MGTCCKAQGTLLNALWCPKWEGNPQGRGYIMQILKIKYRNIKKMSHFSSLSSYLFKGTLFSYTWGFPLFLRSMVSPDRNQRSFAEKDNFLFHSPKRLSCDHVGKYIQNLLLLTSLIPYPTSYSSLSTMHCCVPVLFHANEPPHMLLP